MPVFLVPLVRFVDAEDGREISEKHYKPGSTIELLCVVTNFLKNAFKEVVWRHGNEIVTQQAGRGGIRYDDNDMFEHSSIGSMRRRVGPTALVSKTFLRCDYAN